MITSWIRVSLLLLVFGIAISAYAATEQRTESFPAIPAWEGVGNQTLPQSFGVSASTQNAGGPDPGEGGGYIERGAPAWFADSYLGSLDPTTDAMSFSATLMIESAGNPSFGYFDSNWTTGDPPNGLMFRIDDNNVYLTAIGNGAKVETFAGQVAYGVPFQCELTFDPSGGGGQGTWSMSIDTGSPVTVTLDPGARDAMTLNRFGLFTLGQSSGHGCDFWFDDLDYTVQAGVVVPTPMPFPTPTPLPPVFTALQRVEHFDSDPNWEGLHNRATDPACRTTTQDFGYSNTNHTGGPNGEMGGFIQPAAELAYYAKAIPPLTLNDSLSASGTLIMPDVNNTGQFLLGFFNAQNSRGWRTPNSMVMRLNGRGSNVFYLYGEYGTQLWRAGGTPETSLPIGPTLYSWSLTYDPNGNGGGGRMTLVFGPETLICNLDPGHKADGAVFNRFGLLPVMKSNDNGNEVWLDDLVIQGVPEDFSPDPGWDEFQNRRTYTDCVVRPRFDFGYSPTNYAGAATGELGGVVFRGDWHFESRMAHYADRLYRVSTDHPLMASGTVNFRQGISDSTTLIGWFHSTLSRQGGTDASALPQNFLGIMIEGPSSEGFYFRPVYRMTGLGQSIPSSGPYILPDGSTHTWNLQYDPLGGAGSGQISLFLDGDQVVVNLSPTDKQTGAEFDRFGIITTQIDGHSQFIYFDDLSYTYLQQFTSSVGNWPLY
jgi:hypothetical protein